MLQFGYPHLRQVGVHPPGLLLASVTFSPKYGKRQSPQSTPCMGLLNKVKAMPNHLVCTVQHGTAWHSMAQLGTAWQSTMQP